jgi:TP901 family phage tail tape measure protein
MGTIARMNVALAMDSKDFERGVKDATSAGESLASKLGKIGQGMTAGITLPIVGAAAAAIKFSTDFNASMANIASLGVASDRVAELKGNIQEMAVETGKSTDDLAGGLYQVISAFGDTADTASILEINAKAAAAGLASTSEAIALTSAVTKGYGDTSAAAVQQASDLALMTVQLGQTTFPELAASIGSVTPLAASLGVAQEELFAVMATGTGVTGNASAVSTQLRGVLQSLMAPTADMTALMKSMGYTSGEAMLQSEGLQGTIAAITAAAEASGTPLQKYIGSIEGQTLALALGGPQADAYAQKLAAMGDAAGATDTAFLAQTQGINAGGFAMQQLSIQATVIMQKLGDGLAPALGKVLALLTPVADAVINLANQFASTDAGTQTMIVGALALVAALGPVLAMLPAIGTALAVLTGPVGLVVAAVAALGAAWATNFGGIQDITASVAGQVGTALQSMLSPLQMIGAAMLDAGVASGEAWEAFGLLPAPLAAAGRSFQDFYTSLQQAVTMLGAFLAPAIARMQEAFAGVGPSLTQLAGPLQGLQDAFAQLWVVVQPILAQLAAAIGVTLAVAADVGINTLAAVFANLPALVLPAINQVTASITLIATTLQGMTTLVTALLNGDWAGAWAAAEDIFQGFATFFNATVGNLSAIATAVFTTIGQVVMQTMSDMGVDVQGTLQSLSVFWSGIWDAMSKAIEPVMAAIDGLKKGIEDFSSWVSGISIPNPFAGIGAGFSGAVGAVQNAVGGVVGGITGQATGGPVTAGVPYIVGERGQELFIPNVSGRIIPNSELGGMWDMSSIGGNGAPLIGTANVYNQLDVRELAYAVAGYQARRR